MLSVLCYNNSTIGSTSYSYMKGVLTDLAVKSKTTPKTNRNVRVYYSQDGKSSKILLQGHWLQEAGFQPGDYLSISVRKNKLIIDIKEKFVTE